MDLGAPSRPSVDVAAARDTSAGGEVASRRAAWEALSTRRTTTADRLANRTAFLVARIPRSPLRGAATLVLVDLHRFKDINDALGTTWRRVLCEVADG